MMAAPRIDRDPHASDAELVRLLDGAAAGEERLRLEAHALACADCAERLERQRRRSARLSLVLADGDDDAALDRRAARLAAGFGATVARRPVRLPGYFRAAAVLVGLLALGWAVRPVRAWIVARWTSLVASDAVVRPERPPTQAVAPAAAEAATSVAFVPGAADFVVAFDVRPAGGRLEVRRTAGAQLTFTSSGHAGVLVLPGELHVQNAPASTADFRVGLPAGVARLRVRVGERTLLDVAPSPTAAAWSVDLARGQVVR